MGTVTHTAYGTGRVLRVAGPLVEAEVAGGTAMNDLVELGEARLPGEVVAIRDSVITVQAYEYTGGLAPGMPVRPLGRPLSAALGPGLLDHIRAALHDSKPYLGGHITVEYSKLGWNGTLLGAAATAAHMELGLFWSLAES